MNEHEMRHIISQKYRTHNCSRRIEGAKNPREVSDVVYAGRANQEEPYERD